MKGLAAWRRSSTTALPVWLSPSAPAGFAPVRGPGLHPASRGDRGRVLRPALRLRRVDALARAPLDEGLHLDRRQEDTSLVAELELAEVAIHFVAVLAMGRHVPVGEEVRPQDPRPLELSRREPADRQVFDHD